MSDIEDRILKMMPTPTPMPKCIVVSDEDYKALFDLVDGPHSSSSEIRFFHPQLQHELPVYREKEVLHIPPVTKENPK